jgi:Phospholipase B/S-layer like family, C-terminal region
MRRLPVLLAALVCCLTSLLAQAAEPTPSDLQPDPRTIQRYGPAYRYPQAGWIVLHIEGEPYERGVQHGRLMAPEIAAQIRCLAKRQSSTAPADGWKATRTLVNSLFLRRYDKEYLEEMKGIADGAAAAGSRFDGRAVDVVDIVAINAWAEIMTLDEGLSAEPTGLECLRCVEDRPKTPVQSKPERCSAFAAVGPATADGKIVFGHITMYLLYESNFFNVWLDVKSAKGHRVLMQGYPGAIQSGLDYYLNDAGILCAETTIAQTRFDASGLAEASRIRKALQYADSIDKAVEILKEQNNGLYTNEWMLADVKTNEIAMFELGTKKSKLYRSSKNEWFGGTEGFYWGCNNTKDLDVRLETIDDLKDGRPASAVFHPSDRDRKWLELYDKYKGKIDVEFGKLAFTTPPIAAYHSVDAKFTTSDMAKELKTWALFGPPLGRTWQPTDDDRRKFPEVQPLVGNPWTVLTAAAPPTQKATGPAVVDLHNPENGVVTATAKRSDTPETTPAWHGTLLPKTDADAWLASAFRDYERFAALDNAFRKASKGKLTREDRDELAVILYAARAEYNLGARAHPEASLNDSKSDLRQSDWYRVASGKGMLRLNAMRMWMGAAKFDALMEEFGREHGGQPTTAAEFEQKVVTASGPLDGKTADGFCVSWVHQSGLPRFKLGKVVIEKVQDTPAGKHFDLALDLQVENSHCDCPVDVTVESAHGEVVKRVTAPSSTDKKVHIEVDAKPLRVVVDKYNLASKANGGAFTVLTFKEEPEQTLIVYGAGDEVNANREAADALQQAIRASHSNVTVPIKSDREVTDEELKTRHLLLIGRPDSNKTTARFADELPVAFGARSFTVRGEAYAHADSAVLAAAENPLNRRYSVVVIAGLSSASTLRTAPLLVEEARQPAEVVILPHGRKAKSLTAPAKDLMREVETGQAQAEKKGE